MSRLREMAIAADQLLNTVFGGHADETISARCWRRREVRPYSTLRPVIDGLFFWQTDHCRKSYESERARSQLPREYRDATASELKESPMSKLSAPEVGSYAGGAAAIGASLTLTQVGVLVGIFTALLTFFLNAWYTRQKNAREQKLADLEVREREVRLAQLEAAK